MEFECEILPTRIEMVSTHTEFLRRVFNTSGPGGKAIKKYPKNQNISIWMVSFTAIKENWKNRTVKIDGQDYIREKYIGVEENPMHNGKPISVENVEGKLRLAVSVKKKNGSTTYEILGLYMLDEDLSEDLNRVYKRVEDRIARPLIPEAYDENY